MIGFYLNDMNTQTYYFLIPHFTNMFICNDSRNVLEDTFSPGKLHMPSSYFNFGIICHFYIQINDATLGDTYCDDFQL